MITPELLRDAVAYAEAQGLSDATISDMRKRWSGTHFTYCGEDDVPARLDPVAQGQGFSVFYVSGASHCVSFTTDAELATGLVLAATSDED